MENMEITIKEAIKAIHSNEFVLPAIQREYTWNSEQIEQLFDSIMQGFPIGIFLFWKLGDIEDKTNYTFYKFLPEYHELNNKHNQPIVINRCDIENNNDLTAVLDGQQRLNALYIGLKGTYAYKLKNKPKDKKDSYPKRKLYLNIIGNSKKTDNNDENSEYEFRFLIDKQVKNDEKHYWFKVEKILDMPQKGDPSKFVRNNIHNNNSYSDEQEDYAFDTLQTLYSAIYTERYINCYNIKDADLDTVLNIFIRVNSGGTVLSYSDLLLSTATAEWRNINAREEIIDFVTDINALGFKVDKDFVLKSALVLCDLDIAFKVKNFNSENMQKIEANWETIKCAIKITFELLKSFGYNEKSLTSNNAVIPIAYYVMKINNPKNFIESSDFEQCRKIIKNWLIMALLKKMFSGQPDNVLSPIRVVIKENNSNVFPIDKIIEKFKGTNKTLIFSDDDIESLLDCKFGDKEVYSILLILSPKLNNMYAFHIDHMYPKSKFNKKKLQEKGVKDESIDEYIKKVNCLSNLQLLREIPNKEKNDKDFDVWFNEVFETEKAKEDYRKDNYVPEMQYSYDNFGVFLEKRRKLLKDALEALLK